jgi:NAD(P)-dependent dehydrogenase (short-subunit alcohol dehydrogenase family)
MILMATDAAAAGTNPAGAGGETVLPSTEGASDATSIAEFANRNPSRELDGQVALVTGAARGIGLATVAVLASRGARVVLTDLDADEAEAVAGRLRADGGDVTARPLDVQDEDDVQQVISSVLEELGGIHVLVNNAGTTGPARPVWETPTRHFETMLRVHLLGTFFCVRAVVPSMKNAGYGRIVNVASVAGKEGNPGSGAYSAAKAGVISLTKSLGKELATTGVTVNAVTPGVIDTTMIRQTSPDHIERLISKIPMGRRGRTSEVAEMIAWAASPRCSFTTGSIFDVSGGRTTY